MPAVDRDAMSPAQSAAWDRLWKVLLAPEPTGETRNGGSLATHTATGDEETAIAATGRKDTTNRSGTDG